MGGLHRMIRAPTLRGDVAGDCFYGLGGATTRANWAKFAEHKVIPMPSIWAAPSVIEQAMFRFRIKAEVVPILQTRSRWRIYHLKAPKINGTVCNLCSEPTCPEFQQTAGPLQLI